MDMEKRLQGLGYNVVGTAHTGESAVEKALETKPDLILMDIMLRGEMDGVSAAEEIKKEINVPIVYLTAYSDDETLERAKRTEPFGYLIKPYSEREIYTTVEMALYKHMAEQQLAEEQAKVRVLSGLLPICSSCKKIRDDKGYWQQIEAYFYEHSDVELTHGICPDCTQKLYPDEYAAIQKKKKEEAAKKK
ncbi:MAG: response regulator [Proteobacteria bacterium]|nr:response regulator [Pseudomonadota bacterium]